ncbi:DUF1090 family protein [Pseudomonas sp. NPDC007930]|uniref:DUF1090 family protein n=1 Tax=Pseudomonas sp. NPDC007930 TaxID=3364417 RepID=UPI0036EB885B
MRLTVLLPWLASLCLAAPALAEDADEPPKGCAALPAEQQAGCNDGALHSTRETTVLNAKRQVSQRQADLDKAMKKGDPEKIDQRKEDLAGARKALQEAVDDLDR